MLTTIQLIIFRPSESATKMVSQEQGSAMGWDRDRDEFAGIPVA